MKHKHSFYALRFLIILIGLMMFVQAQQVLSEGEILNPEEQERTMQQLKGMTRFQAAPKDVAIARLLLTVRNSAMTAEDCLKFYQGMAALDAGMQDVIRTKTALEQAAIDNKWIRNDFLGASYAGGGSTVEKALLVYRRQVTVDAIRQVVREFKGRASRGGEHSVYLAEIGKWASQADEALTFAGDIDFSFVSLDEDLTWAMKKRYDEIVREKTQLDSVKFDSVCTAHGRATPDVYIGEHGRIYGNEAMKGGGLKEINLANGTIDAAAVRGEPVIDQMVKELHCRRAASGEVQPSSNSKEPGLSMEMVRHFNHDIVVPVIFDPIDSILKAAKYVDRSNDALSQSFSPAELQKLNPENAKLARFCKEITGCAKKSNFKEMARLITAQFPELKTIVSESGGRPQAKMETSKDIIDKFFKTCTEVMWKNAEAGFRVRLKEIDRRLFELDKAGKKTDANSPEIQTMRADMLALLEMCKIEFAACGANHLEVPPPVKALFDELKTKIESFTRRSGIRPLTEDEMKKLLFVEEMIRSGKKPLCEIAKATILKLSTGIIDGPNWLLDRLDDKLLGQLRGESTEFDTFVAETRALNAELAKPGDKAGSLAKLSAVKSKALNLIKGANIYMNGMIQSTAAGRGLMKGMAAVNLYQEIDAYYAAYKLDGYAGLSTEFFRRRVPGGSIADAYYQDNYLRSGVELVYLIFPPLAIPEGLYGMAMQGVESGVSKMNEWKYKELVDELYQTATFRPGGPDSKGFTLYKISYDCSRSGKGVIELTRDQVQLLPDKCPYVFQLIAPQIKYYPAVRLYEEMLAKPQVSDSHDSIFPYTYSGLSLYGTKLQEIYRKQVDKVVAEYFKGVVEELEKRRNFEGGKYQDKLAEIDKELKCENKEFESLLSVTGAFDQKYVESILNDYDAIKKANQLIDTLKKEYNAEFLTKYEPVCSFKSVQDLAAKARVQVKAFETAIADARAKVEKILGTEDPDLIEKGRPATRARLGMSLYDQNSEEYRRWHTTFEIELGKLQKTDVGIKFDLPSKAYAGLPVVIRATYDRVNKDRIHAWEFVNNSTEKFTWASVDQAKWVPTVEGTYIVRLKVKESQADTKWVTKTVEVMVLPASMAPKLSVRLISTVTTIARDEVVPVTVETVSSLPGDPYVRYFFSENGVQKLSTDTPLYQFQGFGKSGKIALSVIARTASGLLSNPAEISINVLESVSDAASLRVWILPADRNEIGDQDAVELQAGVGRKRDSGELKYQWSVDGQPVSNKATMVFRGEDYLGKTSKITLYVQDIVGGQLRREGQADKTIKVAADKLAVSLSPCPETVQEGGQCSVKVLQPDASSGQYSYCWYEWDERQYGTLSYGDKDTYTLPARREGTTIALKVVVKDSKGRIGIAETRKIKVVAAPKGLTVSINPNNPTVIRGQSVTMTVRIERHPDSGNLTVNGVELPAGASTTTLRFTAGKGDAPIQSITASVIDEKGRRGEATAQVFIKDEVKAPVTPEVPGTTDGTGKTQTSTPPTSVVAKAPATLTISAPSEVMATSLFDAKAAIDPPNAQVTRYNWMPSPLKQSGSSATFQFSAESAGARSISCTAIDERGEVLARAEKSVTIGPPFITGTIPSTWTAIASQPATNFSSSRKTDGKLKVYASVGASWSGQSAGALKSKLSAALSQFKRSPSVSGLSISDFAGSIKELPEVEITSAPGSLSGSTTHTAQASGIGYVEKERSTIEVGYNVSASVTDTSSRDDDSVLEDLKSETARAFSEIKGIVAGLKISPRPGITVVPVAATEEKKPTLKLVAVKKTAKANERVRVEAIVENAGAADLPLQYVWTGNHEGTGNVVRFMATAEGAYTLSVAVSGKRGKIGSASVGFTVEKTPIYITGLGKEVCYGQTLPVHVQLPASLVSSASPDIVVPATKPANTVNEGDDQENDPRAHICPPDEEFCPICSKKQKESPLTNLKILWHSEPGIEFKNPETTGADNQATFTRMGPIKIWAQIEAKTGEEVSHLETEQSTTNVVAPAFKINFNPSAGGKIGQEIVATVSEQPIVKNNLINFKWDSPSSNNRMEMTNNARLIKFKLKDKLQYDLSVRAVVPTYNEPIGGAIQATYEGSPYVVKAAVEETGPKPQIWDPVQKGLVEIKKGTFAVAERISLKATIEGEPKPEDVRWIWTVNEGTSISNDSSSTPTVSRSSTGSAVATATAKDKDGAVLGSDTVTVPVTVSSDEISAGPPLTLSLSADKTSITSGESIKLTATAIGGKEPFSYSWQGVAGQGATVSFTGSDPGSRKVTVTVKDSRGKSASSSVEIIVAQIALKVSLASDKTTLTAEEKANISATVIGGKAPYEYTWTGHSSGQGPRVEFVAKTPGTQTISATVKDSLGITSEAKLSLTISLPKVDVEKAAAEKAAAEKAAAEKAATEKAAAEKAAAEKAAAEKAAAEKAAAEKAAAEKAAKEYAERETAKSNSVTLAATAQRLWNNGQLDEAVATFSEANKFYPTPSIEDFLNKAARSKKEAGLLVAEAKALVANNKLGDSVKKCQAAFDIWPDNKLKVILSEMTASRDKKAQAASLAEDSQKLWNEGLCDEAMIKYAEANKIWPTKVKEDFLNKVAADKRIALAMIAEVKTLVSRNRLAEAVEKCQSAYKIWPDHSIRDLLKELKAMLAASAASGASTGPGQETIAKGKTFKVGNIEGVLNGPTRPFIFSVEKQAQLDYIETYHWNNGRGKTPGRLGLINLSSGQKLLWSANGKSGQGNVPNAYWYVQPAGCVLAPGKYEIADSDPSTWAQNAASNGRGHAIVKLSPVPGAPVYIPPPEQPPVYTPPSTKPPVYTPPVTKPPVYTPPAIKPPVYTPPAIKPPVYTPPVAPPVMPARINALLENRDSQPVHLWSHGEGISPYNRVGVGASRRRPDLQIQSDNAVTFWAGRNGREIASVKWQGRPQVAAGGWLRVIWNGSQFLFGN